MQSKKQSNFLKYNLNLDLLICSYQQLYSKMASTASCIEKPRLQKDQICIKHMGVIS